MNIKYNVVSAMSLINDILSKALNPNPIGQRNPVTAGFKKSIQIIESLLLGEGIGMISIRDISDNPIAKAIYNCNYLVIDGGHRCRALRDFFMGKFPVNGMTFAMHEDVDLNQIQIPVAMYTCTAAEASHLFKSINTTTPTNFMEMLMSNEESDAAEVIRKHVQFFKEYDNEDQVHPLFGYKVSESNGKIKCDYFDGDLPNPRGKWYEWLAIAIIRSVHRGIVDAGQNQIEDLIEGEPQITKAAMQRVIAFLDSCVELKYYRSRKFNSDIFSAYMLWYFDLLSDGDFIIEDKNKFFGAFMNAYSMLTGTGNTELDDVTIEFKGVIEFVKAFVRRNIKNWANAEAQHMVAMQFALLLTHEDLGIIRLHKKRSLSANQREEKLHIDGGVCAIDGLPLLYCDAVYAHDTPWSKGGVTAFEEGAMVRACHNRDMGTMTLDQYRAALAAGVDFGQAA